MPPSPDALNAHADDLRALAAQLRRLADQCAHTLDGATNLDDSATWQGPYSGRADATLSGWRRGLISTAHEMTATAATWDRAAAAMDAQAADARKTAAVGAR